MSLYQRCKIATSRYMALNSISLGGDNILVHCAAVPLRASLQNERNGSVTLGEVPNGTSSSRDSAAMGKVLPVAFPYS